MMRYKVFQTKEGIRVVSEYCKDIKGIIFQLNFYAGALNDPKGKAGLAHFCEHALMSFSTKNHTRKERNDNLKKISLLQCLHFKVWVWFFYNDNS